MIPKDDEEDLNRKKRNRRDGSEKLDEERQMKEIQRQIRKAADDMDPHEHDEPVELTREEDDQPIAFSMTKPSEEDTTEEHRPILNAFDDEPDNPKSTSAGTEATRVMFSDLWYVCR